MQFGGLDSFVSIYIREQRVERSVRGQWHTEILDQDFPMLDDFHMLSNQGVIVLQGLLRHGIEDSDSVEVGNARCLSQLLLHVLDIGILREVNLARKTLDGLLRSYEG